MKLKLSFGIIIGLILAMVLPNICALVEINRLKNRAMRKDDEIIELHKTIDSLKDRNHIYEIDFTERQAYQRQQMDTIELLSEYLDTAKWIRVIYKGQGEQFKTKFVSYDSITDSTIDSFPPNFSGD
jgi:hypothetical protein